MDPDRVYFPDPVQITPHAIAFAQMMFAHAAFEREVRSLQDDITREHGFGERRANQSSARERSARMVALIEGRLGKGLPETEAIARLLDSAIDLCDERNLLAHGEWWCFDPRTSSILVRGGIRFEGDQKPPAHRAYTAANIEALTDKFDDIAADLYKLRRALVPPPTENELRETQ